MSIGYCGRIELFDEDEFTAIYRYCGENWNDDSETRGDIHALDGEIYINKRCLEIDLYEALKRGDVEIAKPCTSEYSKSRRTGPERMYFALKLLRKVFTQYQEHGKLPEKCSFIV